MDIQIITLNPDQWEDYKHLRMQASKEDFLAWGLTFQEESELSDKWWWEQLDIAQKNAGNWIFFAKDGEKIVGMVAANRVKKLKMNHLVHIHSVYVQQEYRGKKIGNMLMKKLMEVLEKQEYLIIAQMGVAATQEAALRLYQDIGFKVVGKREKVFRNDDQFADEILMEKRLR